MIFLETQKVVLYYRFGMSRIINFFNILTLCSIICALNAWSKDYRVAVLYWSMNIEGQVAMRKGVEEVASDLNSKLTKQGKKLVLLPYVAGDGEEGITNQIKQFNEVIDTKNPDLIIVQPTDSAALVKGLLKANAKKIPVVAYDQYILDGKITSYITSNNYQAGTLNGEYLASMYPNEYEIKLILVEYAKISSTVERVNGFLDALKKEKQKFKIIDSFEAVEPVGGEIAAKRILAKYPQKGSIDAIFTVNDGGGLKIVELLYKANRTEIKTVTIDGDPRSVKNLKEGKLTIIDSAQFCAEIGRQSMKIGFDVLTGKTVPKKVLVPTFPVTKETYNKYPGWLGKIPKTFEKPWKPGTFWNNAFIIKDQR